MKDFRLGVYYYEEANELFVQAQGKEQKHYDKIVSAGDAGTAVKDYIMGLIADEKGER